MGYVDLHYLLGTYADKQAQLEKASLVQLRDHVLDQHYNTFLSSVADFSDKENDTRGHGKRVPYIGWFWRFVTFSDPTSIPIGDCGEFVGFMENNKWDYPQRNLTHAEFAHVIALIDSAMTEGNKGGSLADIWAARDAKLSELWDYMQTLNVGGMD